jgi:hypothetical protein
MNKKEIVINAINKAKGLPPRKRNSKSILEEKIIKIIDEGKMR